MVQCALEDSCRREEWYHVTCLTEPVESGKIYFLMI